MAAHDGHAGNEAAARLVEAGCRRSVVPERAAALVSCAQPILPEPELCSIALADRIFWQGIRDEVDPLRPFQLGKQSAETVGLTFGSANVRTLLPAERSAASRAGPRAMSGRRVGLTDQLQQAGFPSWVFTTRDAESRQQVRAACLGSFAAAAGKAGQGGVKLWIRHGYPVLRLSRTSLATGGHAADWEDTAGAEFHALLLEWDLCLPATMPGPRNDPARPARTWCSRTRWHRFVFVSPLPGTWAVDRAMPVMELVISPSKVGHECSRSIDAGAPSLASRLTISGRMKRLFLLDFQWMSTRTC